MDKDLAREELEAGLPHFTGSEEFHRVQKICNKPVYATDGVKFLCDKGGCYWLLDAITSHQPKLRGEDFQTWKLTVNVEGTIRNGIAVNRGQAMLVCEDGNNNKLRAQSIPFTDFPMSEITLYAQVDDEKIVIMLPGEY